MEFWWVHSPVRWRPLVPITHYSVPLIPGGVSPTALPRSAFPFVFLPSSSLRWFTHNDYHNHLTHQSLPSPPQRRERKPARPGGLSPGPHARSIVEVLVGEMDRETETQTGADSRNWGLVYSEYIFQKFIDWPVTATVLAVRWAEGSWRGSLRPRARRYAAAAAWRGNSSGSAPAMLSSAAQ